MQTRPADHDESAREHHHLRRLDALEDAVDRLGQALNGLRSDIEALAAELLDEGAGPISRRC